MSLCRIVLTVASGLSVVVLMSCYSQCRPHSLESSRRHSLPVMSSVVNKDLTVKVKDLTVKVNNTGSR